MGRPMEARRSFASLKPALLARKGAARPAVRLQVAALEAGPAELGWNDFGPDGDVTGTVVPITRKPRRAAALASAAKASGPAAAGRKAAFTFRLDAERHLRLRLACALDERSAQALMTDALDRLLSAMPELEQLASQVTNRRKPRSGKS